jgi:uncharacterized protein (TIGR00266 family)
MQADVRGETMPVLEITLQNGEQVITPHGELSWMSPNIQMSQTLGGGKAGGGGLMGGLKRALGGGGLMMTRYQAGGGQGFVAFAAKVPGHILPIDVGPEQTYLVHRHGWIAGTEGVVASVGMQQSFRGGLWGGDGFLLQKLEGQGRAWIELSGELTTYTLAAGQTLMVHPGHVGLFQSTVQFSMTRIPGIANKIFGGDGFMLVALTGPGQIWLQSLPLPNLAHALQPYLATESIGNAAEGGAIGGIVGGIFR